MTLQLLVCLSIESLKPLNCRVRYSMTRKLSSPLFENVLGENRCLRKEAKQIRSCAPPIPPDLPGQAAGGLASTAVLSRWQARRSARNRHWG
jgi:hypothetical protein